jgi:hypothetical protein
VPSTQIATTHQRSAVACCIPLIVTFEQALKDGDLDVARAILDELVELPDTGGLWMPECYADLGAWVSNRPLRGGVRRV